MKHHVSEVNDLYNDELKLRTHVKILKAKWPGAASECANVSNFPCFRRKRAKSKEIGDVYTQDIPH